jgi:hypothetical protein
MSYTPQEDYELNKQLKKWQNRARRLILSNYYDIAAENLSENIFAILQKITNAKSHEDIQPYLWNSGIIEITLDRVANEVKKARKESREC